MSRFHYNPLFGFRRVSGPLFPKGSVFAPDRSSWYGSREKGVEFMTVERFLRMIAGLLVLASVVLGYWLHPYWFALTAFVGLNLFQSAFTDWCPMMTLLRRLGVPDGKKGRGQHPAGL